VNARGAACAPNGQSALSGQPARPPSRATPSLTSPTRPAPRQRRHPRGKARPRPARACPPTSNPNAKWLHCSRPTPKRRPAEPGSVAAPLAVGVWLELDSQRSLPQQHLRVHLPPRQSGIKALPDAALAASAAAGGRLGRRRTVAHTECGQCLLHTDHHEPGLSQLHRNWQRLTALHPSFNAPQRPRWPSVSVSN